MDIRDSFPKNKAPDEVTENPVLSHSGKDEASQMIMKAAAKLFADKGFEATSTRDIAQASGLNVSLISYYFGGKVGLYRKIIETFAHQLEAQISSVVESFEAKGLDQSLFEHEIRTIIEFFVNMRSENPHVGRILKREEVNALPHSREVYDQVFSRIGVSLAGLIEKGQRKGFISKKIHPPFAVWALVHMSVDYFTMNECKSNLNELCFDLPEQKRDLIEQIFLMFTKGVLK
ncbi:MAG TPA: TetR family transcriptional regulator [Pseudobdellovibrionaceae bacterium]|nr:TetR family transcriptional regulator [Pseudobdellovibrionaceae bacterium]